MNNDDQEYDPHSGPKVTLPMAGISNQIAAGPKSFTLVQMNGKLYPVPFASPIQELVDYGAAAALTGYEWPYNP